MGKPRAARKQPIVLSSDEDEADRTSPPPKRPKRGTLTSISQNGARGDSNSSKSQAGYTASPRPSPSKRPQKSPSKSPAKPKPIYKPITSFFGNASSVQTSQPNPSPEKPTTKTLLEAEDDICDLDSEDEPPAQERSAKTQLATALALRKRGKEGLGGDEGLVKGSQRFLRMTNGSRNTTPPSQSAQLETPDNRPWTERFGPLTLDELAVHKKKVSDVRTWLSEVLSGRERKRLLLLKGPAGSGKTTTMALLSKELGFDIHEWKNPTSSTSTEGFVSITAQFEDFVGRTGAFGSLAFEPPGQVRPAQPAPATQSRQKQVILVEEFPNTFARASTTLQSFRSSLLHYLAANVPSATAFFSGKQIQDQPVTPIVMIISETLLSTNTAAADSFTAHRLLGPEILTHPGVTVIEFNPIAPTYMAKALDLVVLKEARKSGRRKTLGPQVIRRLSELGDIRSAISSLEFLCVRGDEDEGWGAKIAFTKKKGAKDVPFTKMELDSLEMVTQRESTLGIFHAVGRVVYNKRLSEESNGEGIPQPPHWFPERRRPKVSEVHVDSLIDELGTDTQTFIAALHENYVLSCEGADSEETMDSIDGCIDALSEADLLSCDRFGATGFGKRNFQGTSADNLRQEEMSFQVGVRGLLYSLPCPVKRIAPPPRLAGNKGKGSFKGSAFVMYYPTSLRIWRQQEEIGGLLEIWINRAQKGELLTSGTNSAKAPSTAGGVESWRKSNPFSQSAKASSAPTDLPAEEPPPPVLLGSGGSARYEMLLERLPYLPLVLRKSAMPSPSIAATIRDIKKITAFSGIGIGASADEDEDDEQDAGEQEHYATDRPGPETPRKRRRKNMIEKKADDTVEDMALRGKEGRDLVLSDDDIED